MGMKLNEILLEVETNKFEQNMWEFAVKKYLTLSKKYDGETLEEKFDLALNNRFNNSKRNNTLLENMNIDYMFDDETDNEFDLLVEEFEKFLNDEDALEEGFADTAADLVAKSKQVIDTTVDKAKQSAQDAGSAVKTKVDKVAMSLAEKWEKVKNVWSSMLKVFKEWMTAAKLSTKELATILTNEGFVKAFKTTMSKLFKGLQQLLNLWADSVSKVQDFVFKGLKQSKVGKSLDEISAFLDKKLNQDDDKEWKKYARIALGVGVVWVTYYIWTKMFFIGDWRYDFDYSAAIGTMTGAVDFQSVLGAEWIPTLTWFVAGLVSNTFNLVVPCPPSCDWFGKWNLVAAGFVTAYIMSTNGSLKKIKDSEIGTKVQNWLKSQNTNNNKGPKKSKESDRLLKVGTGSKGSPGKLLNPI